MAIASVILGGYGNGTVTGTIPLVVLSGYTAGAAVAATAVSRGGILPKRKKRPDYKPKTTKDLVSEAVDEFIRDQEAPRPAVDLPEAEGESPAAVSVPPSPVQGDIALDLAAMQATILEREIAIAARQREDDNLLTLLLASV